MRVGIIGLGYWGPNIVRNFIIHPDVDVVVGCDINVERQKFIKSKFPSIEVTSDFNRLLKSDIDIIAVVTNVYFHFQFVKAALESGKHVWVEKPFTATVSQAKELIEIAEKKNLKIFVDHTFIYTGAVQKVKELINSGDIGNIKYFDSVRINLGLFQHDVNVIWDLAPHDFSIMNYILNKKVRAVSANGIANYSEYENVANISVYLEDNCYANFHVNWTSPVKIRKMIIGGDKKMLVYDDMENFEKIKVYDTGIEMKTSESIHEALIQYRIGDMYSPKVIQTEALSLGVSEFISAINENRNPLTNAYDGLEVVKILEASTESIKYRGKLIEIN